MFYLDLHKAFIEALLTPQIVMMDVWSEWAFNQYLTLLKDKNAN